jgi:hypothetical protein
VAADRQHLEPVEVADGVVALSIARLIASVTPSEEVPVIPTDL